MSVQTLYTQSIFLLHFSPILFRFIWGWWHAIFASLATPVKSIVGTEKNVTNQSKQLHIKIQNGSWKIFYQQDIEMIASNSLIPRKPSRQAPHVPDVLEQSSLCKAVQLGALVQFT